MTFPTENLFQQNLFFYLYLYLSKIWVIGFILQLSERNSATIQK